MLEEVISFHFNIVYFYHNEGISMTSTEVLLHSYRLQSCLKERSSKKKKSHYNCNVTAPNLTAFMQTLSLKPASC